MELGKGGYCLTMVIFLKISTAESLCAYGSPYILTGVVCAFEYTEYEIQTQIFTWPGLFWNQTKRNVDDVFNQYSVFYNNYWSLGRHWLTRSHVTLSCSQYLYNMIGEYYVHERNTSYLEYANKGISIHSSLFIYFKCPKPIRKWKRNKF